jgi:NAD kinase
MANHNASQVGMSKSKCVKRCVVIGKRPLLAQLQADESERLAATVPERWQEINESAQAHADCLSSILAELRKNKLEIRQLRVDDLSADVWTPDDTDLVITVGGDGTVLATHPHCFHVPVLPINSDPNRSTGWLTSATLATWQSVLAHWLDTPAAHEITLPRLQAGLDGATPQAFLNDCLLTNANPAALSRYQLQIGTDSENQSSSGIWISTPIGATGALTSAGGAILGDSGRGEAGAGDASAAARSEDHHGEHAHAQGVTASRLLYRVREPLQRQRTYQLLGGSITPHAGYRIRSLQAGLTAYLDGAYRQITIPAGRALAITPAPVPLRLVGGLPAHTSGRLSQQP